MGANEPVADARDCFGLVGTVLDSRYRIEHVVAVGGFGVVYRATHIELDHPVAIKVMMIQGSPTEAARKDLSELFVAEAKTVKRLRHDHIVKVEDLAVSQMPSGVTAPWMALEWLDGRTLQTELSERVSRGEGRMPVAEALALLRPVIDAVAYAHEERIAHRDLKPANIMLVPHARSISLYVLDFGVSKKVDPEGKPKSGQTETIVSPAGFSPSYAALEQFRNLRTGPWTDVHALGLILTEMLVGRRPYESQDLFGLFAEANSEPRPTPAQLGVDVGALEPVLARALARNTVERFADAREFLEALDGAVGSTRSLPPVSPTPPAPVVELVLERSGPPSAPPPTPPAPSLRNAPTAPRARVESYLRVNNDPSPSRSSPSADPLTTSEMGTRRLALIRGVVAAALLVAVLAFGWVWWSHAQGPAPLPGTVPTPDAPAPRRIESGPSVTALPFVRPTQPEEHADASAIAPAPSPSAALVDDQRRRIRIRPPPPSGGRSQVEPQLVAPPLPGTVPANDAAVTVDRPSSIPDAARPPEDRGLADLMNNVR